ncbi:MAG: InlB B-repeat-containing protein, partial [Clostridia bacterium]|nr:InlB B-repeat-containing protein [Clostridia bacterium]
MKTRKFVPRFYIALLVLAIITALSMTAFAVTPSDENFDDDSSLTEYGAQFTNDGIKYTLGGTVFGTMVSNDSWSPLGDADSDYYMNVGTDTSVKIEAADGSSFKLKSFDIDAMADTNILVTPSIGSAVIFVSNSDWVTQTVDLSGNTDFNNITYFTISGSNLLLCIDNLDFEDAVLPTYSVTYNGNNNTGGAVPTDGLSYHNGDTATVLGNTGSLVKTGYTFNGWNTAANGSGTPYIGGDTFSMGSSNVTLYAQWTAVDYTVTYNGNTNTGGLVPIDGNTYNITDTVTVLGNTGSLVKTGYTFNCWNTAANGSGTDYSGGETFAMGS